jgi:hypothetical protein
VPGAAPLRWDTSGLASVGVCCGWLLVFIHEAYEIFVDLALCVDDGDPFAHFKVHPFLHIVVELMIVGLAGALAFAGVTRIRNRLVRAA